jgi:hypothetical protein
MGRKFFVPARTLIAVKLFKKCPKQPALECPIDAFGASARPMVVFSGFYESH